MVSSPFFGGDLVFSVLSLGPPFQVTLSLDATGSFVPKTGNATVGGTVTCNQPAEVDVSGQLRQKLRRRIIVGSFSTHVSCDGETPWSAIARSDQWAFGRGRAEILGEPLAVARPTATMTRRLPSYGCANPYDEASCDVDSVSMTIRLKGRK